MTPVRAAKLAVLVLLALTLACQTTQTGKPLAKMSPKEQLVFAMSMYNTAFDNYKATFEQFSTDGIDDVERKYLTSYLMVLESAWPVIRLYQNYVDSNTLITPELQLAFEKAIKNLSDLFAKGVN